MLILYRRFRSENPSWTFRCFSLLWLVLLGSAPPADSQPADVKPRHDKFMDQHYDADMTEQKCTRVIGQRKISDGDTNKCKKKNTFVTATKNLQTGNLLKAVCVDAGTRVPWTRDLYESNQPFPVVICTLKSGATHPKCEYRGVKSTRYIKLACDQGWPVHYDGDIVDA